MSSARKEETLSWTGLVLNVLVGNANVRQGRAPRSAEQAQKAIRQLQDVLREPLAGSRRGAPDVATARTRRACGPGACQCDLSRGEATVLTVIAQHTDGVSREQLSVLTRYKRSSRDAYLRRLAAAGRIETRNGYIHSTDLGIEALGAAQQEPPRSRGRGPRPLRSPGRA